MGVKEFYKNKNILIIGVTGFLGKVILEKFLRVLPDVGIIYLLIRKKEGLSPIERLKKTILGTPCFDVLRKSHQKFDEFISSKGANNLDLSEEDTKTLMEKVNIVINCAAPLGFNAPLNEAIQFNVQGTLRILALCKRVQNLENFVHVSTCFANSDKKGMIEERIYPIAEDPEILLTQILNTPLDQIASKTSLILGDYPNTYTFTQSLSERILQKTHQTVPLSIVRPSILGCSYRDPFTGWIDTVGSAGALYLFGGIGLLQVSEGDKNIIGDQIPVDFCADAVIVAGAAYARSKEVKVVHCGTSGLNPVSLGYAIKAVSKYWQTYPPASRVASCNLRLQRNKKLLRAEQFLRRTPTLVSYKIAKSVNSTSMIRTTGKNYQDLRRSEELSNLLSYFTTNQWIFITNRLKELQAFCSEDENGLFQLDVKTINWRKYFSYFAWGLHRFILKENIDPPTEAERSDVLLSSGKGIVSIVDWVLNRGADVYIPPKTEYKSLVLNSERVRNAIKSTVVDHPQPNMSDPQFEAYLYKQAEKHCEFIFSNFNMKALRTFGAIVHSALRVIYEKIVVDHERLKKLQEYSFKQSGPFIFVPTHRSYVDFVLMSYILFAFSVRIPQIVAAEDFLNMAVIPQIFRGTGAFFIRRKRVEYMEVYNAVLYEYVQRLIMTENWLEFFIEGTRSRYGKTLPAKFGILGMVVDAYLDHKIPNAQIIPVTINYDRIVEGESYPRELLGEPKVKESFVALLKASSILKMNFGKVYFEMAEPIPLDKFVENFKEHKKGKVDLEHKGERTDLVSDLGTEIVYKLNENLVVMPTAIVSSVILMSRKGIREEILSEKSQWLIKQILLRKGKVGVTDENFSYSTVRNAIGHVQHLLEQRKDVYYVRVSDKEGCKNILLLSSYRNTLCHIFWNEAIIACALGSFGRDIAWKEGVLMERLWEEVSFLHTLLYREFQLRERITKENFPHLLDQMAKRGILKLEKRDSNTLVKVDDENAETIMSFLCNLVWPFISSYWVGAVYLFNMKNRTALTPSKKLIREVIYNKYLLSKRLNQIQWFCESLYDERVIEYYEACAIDTIKNSISAFKELKIIRVNKQMLDKTVGYEENVIILADEPQLKELEANIKKFLRISFTTSVGSVVDLTRKTMMLDYLNMSKI